MPGPLEDSFSLLENGYRWYKPRWGRYSQSDPIWDSLLIRRPGTSIPVYGYASLNSLRYIDSLGLCDECDLCPTGKWQYEGNVVSGGELWGGLWFANFGFAGFGGEFECLNETGFPLGTPRVGVHIECEVDRAIGFDIGIDFFETSMGTIENACNAEDLLEGIQGGSLVAIPVFGFSHLGNGPWNIEASLSFGFGYARMECRASEVRD